MSISVRSPDNPQKIIHQKIKKKENKIIGFPINVKMFKIPNGIGLVNKKRTNMISSSYFNLNLKNKTNLILRQIKNSKNKKTSISRLTNDINTNFYSLSITNNNSNSINNIISNNNSNNYSKISNNSILIHSKNKSNRKIIKNKTFNDIK